ncbi:hypothetical protein CFOL_v3_18098, partial [Cephalotus follicularis]
RIMVSLLLRIIYFIIFHLFLIQFTVPISSLSLKTFTHKNPNFDSEISLFGDAKINSDSSHVQLMCPLASSSGLIMLKNPRQVSRPKTHNTDVVFHGVLILDVTR